MNLEAILPRRSLAIQYSRTAGASEGRCVAVFSPLQVNFANECFGVAVYSHTPTLTPGAVPSSLLQSRSPSHGWVVSHICMQMAPDVPFWHMVPATQSVAYWHASPACPVPRNMQAAFRTDPAPSPAVKKEKMAKVSV